MSIEREQRDPGKRRSRAERIAETTQKLITAARRSFAQVGYSATSMDDLCGEVGLTRGALYHHFGSKEGLFEAVLRQIDGEISEHLRQIWDHESDPWHQFVGCCQAYLDLTLEPEIQQILLKDAPAVLGQRFRDLDAQSSIAPMQEGLDYLMQLGIVPRTDPEALARLVNGALMDVALWVAASEHPQETLGRAQLALEVILAGLHRLGEANSGEVDL